MTPEIALAELTARAVPDKAAGMAAHHGAGRVYLGIPAHEIDALAGAWRAASPPEARLELAAALWQSDIHEARIAAAKLLAQARIRPDDSGAWRLIVSWVPGFDTLAITEQAAIAGQKRLVADPSRLDEVEGWTRADQVWTRHAALLMTLPWTRQRAPKPAERAVRERVLGWAKDHAGHGERQIRKVLAAWLCALSKRDPGRVRTFLDTRGGRMMPFARRSAARLPG